MGALCPTCQTWQSIVKVHTKDGQPPEKGHDVIFVSLACKHAFGSEEFNEYNRIANKIAREAADRMTQIEADKQSAIGAEFAKFLERKKGGPKK